MKKHVPFLLSLLSIMGLLAWTASVRAQCLSENVTLDLPITGSSSTDLSAYSHTVALQGSPVFVTGQDGSAMSALHFNSPTQYATVAAHPAFELMDDAFTIAAWVYPTSFNSYNAVVSKLNGGHRDILFRYHDDGKLQIHFTNASNGITSVTTDGAVVSTNQWTHLAATWNGTDMKLFVNGSLVKVSTLTESPDFQSAGSVRIGTLNVGSERVVGYVENVQLRAFATPDEEVGCLMASTGELNQGIVLELPLDGNATDVSVNGNNGTITGATAAVDRWSDANTAMYFDGSSDKVVVPNIPAYNSLSNAFTVSAWVYPALIGNNRAIISKAGSGRDIVIRIDSGKLTAHYYVGGYVWCVPLNATVNVNEWTHVACTWDGTTMILYQDGEVLQSIVPATPPSFGSNNWVLGSLTTTGSEYYSGSIDEFNVWNRALGICEIRSSMYANVDLLVEDNLLLCAGQSQMVEPIGGLCSVLWTNDNSTEFFYDIVADDLGVGDHQIVLEAYDHFDHFYSDTVNVTVSLCTGITESQNQTIMKMYPNPASRIVTVNGVDLSQIDLLDISGRLLESVTVLNSTQTDLNLTTMPSGVYFVRAIAKDGTVESKRLIKH